MKKNLLLTLTIFLTMATFAQNDSVAVKSKKFSWDKLKNSRYISSDEVGGLIGIAGRAPGKMYFSYQSINGWQFNKHTYIAPGFGIELSGKNGTMVNEGTNTTTNLMIPLFGEIRYSFLSKKVSPFISQKTGYSFYLPGPKPSSTIVGGAMMQTQIGVKAYITRYAAVNFSVGYRLQCLAVPSKFSSQFNDAVPTVPSQIDVPKTDEFYHYLTFHLGFTY
jgi:hypothetical protein